MNEPEYPVYGRDAADAAVNAQALEGGPGLIDRLAAEWRDLCREGPCDAPFYQPEWFLSYVRAFAPGAGILLVTARMDGRLIGILPLVRSRGRYSGIPARKLMSAGNVHTCRYDLIHGRSSINPVPALWRVIASLPGWDVLELNDVVRTGMARRLARHISQSGYDVAVMRSSTSPYVRLSSTNAFAQVLGAVDSKFRANLRRRMRKLEAHGPVRLEVSSEPAGGLDAFYALEQSGWKGAEQSAIACSPATRMFYDSISDAGARGGAFALYTLKAGDTNAAMFHGLRHGSRYYLLKTAYETSLRDCSPGQLLTQEVLRDLAASGCTEFDFLGEMMEWKRDWAPQLRAHANWYVFRGPVGALVRCAHFGVRRKVGRALRRLR